MQFINLNVGHIFLFPRSGLYLNGFSICLVVPITCTQSRYKNTPRATVNITKTFTKILKKPSSTMYKIYIEIFYPFKNIFSSEFDLTIALVDASWAGECQHVFVQRVVTGEVEDSFIAETPLETDFALRHTEVASTMMHVSSLTSVVSSRNSFVSMGPNKWGWKENNQAGQNQAKLNRFRT